MNHNIYNKSNIRKTIHYLQKNGIKHTFYAAKERIEEKRKSTYAYEQPTQAVLGRQKESWHKFPYRFSIVVPAYETKEEYLRELIDSVRDQSYERWELIIADASKSGRVEEIVAEYQEKENERRIRYLHLMENRGISENTNAGIEIAAGDYTGLLDHDDVLTPDALYEMAQAIAAAGQNGITPVLLYSDEDKMETGAKKAAAGNETTGKTKYCYHTGNIKKEFNLDLILSNNYICHFMIVETNLMKMLKLRKEYDGAQDYDFVLRVVDNLLSTEKTQVLEEKIIHISKVLYHWRCHELSTADNTASKTYAYEAGKAALEDFCRKRDWEVKVSHALHLGFYQIEYLSGLFAARQDVGIIGGRIIDRHNKITSGIYDGEGNRLYLGLHKEYSGGAAHTASLMQDAAAVDIRCMRVREELRPVFEQITGISYRETGKWKLADVSAVSCDEEGYRKLSMEFGAAAAKLGYRVVWNPHITIRLA